ncbi:MAG: hypothetical protein MPF33_04860 [Candidatus Aramenus sp.]|jgi:hypothetical protein|nr:hypothetical protein [Candidatus Aramenus sp.]
MNTWKTVSLILIAVVVVESAFLYSVVQKVTGHSFNVSELNSPAFASVPHYIQPPVVGNYSFIIKNGIKFYYFNTSNYTLVTAFVLLNLSKVKAMKDWFLLYVPIDEMSTVPSAFFNTPLANVSIVNDTVFYEDGSSYLTFGVKIKMLTINEISGGKVTFLLRGPPKSAAALNTLLLNTDLVVVFKLLNQSVMQMEFYVIPTIDLYFPPND